MRPIEVGRCSICGEGLVSPHVFANDNDEAVCGLCRRAAPPFLKATAYGSYEGGLRELIHLLKYEGVRPAANVLGRMLADAVADLHPSLQHEDSLFAEPVLVIPVPLHARKLRQREFNQSEMIARVALKLRHSPTELALAAEVLIRQRETQSQIGLTRHQRRENMRGAFAVAKPEVVQDRDVLLVDDVFTTGTTVSECARVLRRAGAKRIWVATVARTMKAEAQNAVQRDDREEESAATMAAHG